MTAHRSLCSVQSLPWRWGSSRENILEHCILAYSRGFSKNHKDADVIFNMAKKKITNKQTNNNQKTKQNIAKVNYQSCGRFKIVEWWKGLRTLQANITRLHLLVNTVVQKLYWCYLLTKKYRTFSSIHSLPHLVPSARWSSSGEKPSGKLKTKNVQKFSDDNKNLGFCEGKLLF